MLSIRLSLNGQPFYIKRSGQNVIVEISTHNVTLVPDCIDLSQSDNRSAITDSCGMDSQFVRVEVSDKISLLVNLPSELQTFFANSYGEQLIYSHKLAQNIQAIMDATSPKLRVVVADSFLHIVLVDNGLVFADSLPYTTPEDMLYTLYKIGEAYSLRKTTIELAVLGDDTAGVQVEQKRLVKLLSKYYKSVKSIK